jgi:hypothetical protein
MEQTPARAFDERCEEDANGSLIVISDLGSPGSRGSRGISALDDIIDSHCSQNNRAAETRMLSRLAAQRSRFLGCRYFTDPLANAAASAFVATSVSEFNKNILPRLTDKWKAWSNADVVSIVLSVSVIFVLLLICCCCCSHGFCC